LIYPEISLNDPVTVKKALLLYDNLFRIVPEKQLIRDNKEIAEFNREYEIIKEIKPDGYTKTTAERFEKNLDNWRESATGFHHEIYSSQQSHLHADKVYYKLREKLVEQNILDPDGKWLRGNNALIAQYMLLLANEISIKNDLTLITDDIPSWTCQEFINYDANFHGDGVLSYMDGSPAYPDDSSYVMVGIYLEEYIPENLESISFDSIMRFRDEYEDQRKNFVKEYVEFQDKISSLQNSGVRETHINEYKWHLQQKTDEYREALQQSYISVVSAGYQLLTAPVITDIACRYLVPESPLSGGLAGCALAVGLLWGLEKRREDIKEICKNNPCSFLVNLQGYDFETVKYLNRKLGLQFHEFIND